MNTNNINNDLLHISHNYNIVQHLQDITTTYDFTTNKEIPTTNLHFNYYGACDKSAKRLRTILDQIKNRKPGATSRKYQVRGWYEYKVVHNYCTEHNICHELIIDDSVLTNKVTSIHQWVTDYDYENNLRRIEVENEKVPTMYVKVYPSI